MVRHTVLGGCWGTSKVQVSSVSLPPWRDSVTCRLSGVTLEVAQLSPLWAPKGGMVPYTAAVASSGQAGRHPHPTPVLLLCLLGLLRQGEPPVLPSADLCPPGAMPPYYCPWMVNREAFVPLAQCVQGTLSSLGGCSGLPIPDAGLPLTLGHPEGGCTDRCPMAAGPERCSIARGGGDCCLNIICFTEFGPASHLASLHTSSDASTCAMHSPKCGAP